MILEFLQSSFFKINSVYIKSTQAILGVIDKQMGSWNHFAWVVTLRKVYSYVDAFLILAGAVSSWLEKSKPVDYGAKEKAVAKKILQWRNSSLESPDYEAELELFTHVKKSPDVLGSNNLRKSIREFLLFTEHQFFILSGAVKSTSPGLNQYIEKILWMNFQEDQRIPLFIPLYNKGGAESIIQEHFKNRGFDEQAIEIVRKDYKFIFILGCYDEAIVWQDFYEKNKLADWDCKILIDISRVASLNIVEEDQELPLTSSSRKDLLTASQIIIQPCDKASIDLCCKNELDPQSTGNSSLALPKAGQRNCHQQKSFNKLIAAKLQQPFLLLMVKELSVDLAQLHLMIEQNDTFDIAKELASMAARRGLSETQKTKLLTEIFPAGNQLIHKPDDVKVSMVGFCMHSQAHNNYLMSNFHGLQRVLQATAASTEKLHPDADMVLDFCFVMRSNRQGMCGSLIMIRLNYGQGFLPRGYQTMKDHYRGINRINSIPVGLFHVCQEASQSFYNENFRPITPNFKHQCRHSLRSSLNLSTVMGIDREEKTQDAIKSQPKRRAQSR